jgi:hypothetical protein
MLGMKICTKKPCLRVNGQVAMEKQVFAPMIKGEQGTWRVHGYTFSCCDAVNPPFPLYQGRVVKFFEKLVKLVLLWQVVL